MAVPHPPPLPPNAHPSPSPSHSQQHPPPYHLQAQPGQSVPAQIAQSYPHPYATARPSAQQNGTNGVGMLSQQAAQLQAQQRQIQLGQQQQLNQQQQQGQLQRGAVVPPSPHNPSPSPHLLHQGFPINGTGTVNPQQYPHSTQPLGVKQGAGLSPSQLRQPPSHPPPIRPGQYQQAYQQHPSMQHQQQSQMSYPQTQQIRHQPGLNGIAGSSQNLQDMGNEDFSMARMGSGGQTSTRADTDSLCVKALLP